MAEHHYPFALKPVGGAHSLAHVRNAVASLGSEGSSELIDAGWVPADVLFPQTLILLATQPRAAAEQETGERGNHSAIAGGVWVRERLTVHRPVRIGEPFVVEGEIARRYSRKGRQYSVSTSKTRSEQAAPLVTSCTTGLVRYRADPSLADTETGRTEADLPHTGPDWESAARNPAVPALLSAREGDSYPGPSCEVTLEMMRERDGGRNANPIHTEPEQAHRAGLAAPIAGGPHVFGFAQALLMRAFGAEVLLHGAHIDVRWRAPVHAGQCVTANAKVSKVSADRIVLEFRVERDGIVAMLGSAVVPLPAQPKA
jgi:acyl dehydratase